MLRPIRPSEVLGVLGVLGDLRELIVRENLDISLVFTVLGECFAHANWFLAG